MQQLVGIEYVVSLAQETLGYDNDEYRTILREYVYRGSREAFVVYDQLHIKETCIKLEGAKAKKPCDIADLVDMRLVDAGCCKIVRPCYVSKLWRCASLGRSGGCDGTFTVSETVDEFLFSSNVIEAGLVELKLQYYGFFLDEKGFPRIPFDYSEALKHYAIWKHLERKHIKEGFRVIPINMVSYHKNEYIMNKKRANGNRRMPNNMTLNQIGL